MVDQQQSPTLAVGISPSKASIWVIAGTDSKSQLNCFSTPPTSHPANFMGNPLCKEKVMIEELKVELGTLLTTGPHIEFPEVVGEYNLLRFLRGCEHDIPEAVKLFQKHISSCCC